MNTTAPPVGAAAPVGAVASVVAASLFGAAALFWCCFSCGSHPSDWHIPCLALPGTESKDYRWGEALDAAHMLTTIGIPV